MINLSGSLKKIENRKSFDVTLANTSEPTHQRIYGLPYIYYYYQIQNSSSPHASVRQTRTIYEARGGGNGKDNKSTIRLPILFDATCNGLQHLSVICLDVMMARLSNVIPNEDRMLNDTYAYVANKLIEKVDSMDIVDKYLIK